jgi:hypothetical protein
MDLRFSIAVQGVKINRYLVDLNSRAGNEDAERRSDISPWMLIERLEHEDAFGQHNG